MLVRNPRFPFVQLNPSTGLRLTNQLVPADALRPRRIPGGRPRR
jgi:hypothetical protein